MIDPKNLGRPVYQTNLHLICVNLFKKKKKFKPRLIYYTQTIERIFELIKITNWKSIIDYQKAINLGAGDSQP